VLTKKQLRIIATSVVLIVSFFAILFSDSSSEITTSIDPTPTQAIKDSYENEVHGQQDIEETAISVTPNEEPADSTIPDNSYQVVSVIDGDTVDVNIEGKVERLRLIGIDTPETVDPRKEVQCFGKEASNKAKELLEGQFIFLESDDTQGERDKYRRLLRYIFLIGGTNFNQYMISEGYATEYTYADPYKYQADFIAAQETARSEGKGLWSPSTCSGVR
jgi:micrococcal nuclease